MVDSNQISIRKMQYSDFEVMAQWLSTKEVLEFYGDVNAPFTLERVEEKYGPRIGGEVPILPYIVELEHVPVGYIQQYFLTEATQQDYGYPLNLKIYGIDQFIGIPDLFNQGLGTAMVKKFMRFLCLTTDIDIIILDPDVSNARAIRCYEKCGFQKVKKINDGSNWLMEHRRTEM